MPCPRPTTPRSRPTSSSDGRDTEGVRAALDHLARLAGKPLAELDSARRDAVANEFRASGCARRDGSSRGAAMYYRDDRVLRPLGSSYARRSR